MNTAISLLVIEMRDVVESYRGTGGRWSESLDENLKVCNYQRANVTHLCYNVASGFVCHQRVTFLEKAVITQLRTCAPLIFPLAQILQGHPIAAHTLLRFIKVQLVLFRDDFPCSRLPHTAVVFRNDPQIYWYTVSKHVFSNIWPAENYLA